MPSTNKTPNIGLNQYLGNDYQKRLDYNSDMLKIDTAINEVSIFAKKTYAELKTLIDNNGLVEGKKYLLTDYRTKYQQPTTLVIKEMAVEQLVLTANSTNSFEAIVSSPTYPQDIITYNFGNNICEDKTTQRTGFIEKRIDTINKNDCPQDWRTMLWARYKPDATRYYYNGNLTQMQLLPVASVSVSGYLYKYENSLYISKTTGVPTSPTDSSIFYQVYEDINVGMLIEEKTKIADKIELKKGELHERLTFGTNCYKNYIGEILNPTHNNVFGNECFNNTLETSCYNNTFGNSSYSNYLGNNSYFNIIMNNCIANSFDTYCSRNILGNSCISNGFGSNFDKNILTFSCSNNRFGNNCDENILTASCDYNSFGNRCYSNTLGVNCNNNNFGNLCYSNVFGYASESNSFSTSCYGNKFGNSCDDNSFGNLCDNNTFGNDCRHNSLGNKCIENKIGNVFQGNTMLSGCGVNTIGNNCISNFFGESTFGVQFADNLKNIFAKFINGSNLTSLDIYNKPYTITIEKNSSSKYIYWYINSSGQIVSTQIP